MLASLIGKNAGDSSSAPLPPPIANVATSGGAPNAGAPHTRLQPLSSIWVTQHLRHQAAHDQNSVNDLDYPVHVCNS